MGLEREQLEYYEQMSNNLIDEILKTSKLVGLGAVSKGNKTAILCSSLDECCEYSKTESKKQVRIGEFYKHRINESYLIRNAVFQDVGDVIDDSQVSNIMVVGHSTFSTWIASDGPIGLPELVEIERNHLKSGFVAKLGCNSQKLDIGVKLENGVEYIPFGCFLLGNRDRLYFPKQIYPFENHLKDPAQLRSVYAKHQTLEQELRHLS